MACQAKVTVRFDPNKNTDLEKRVLMSYVENTHRDWTILRPNDNVFKFVLSTCNAYELEYQMTQFRAVCQGIEASSFYANCIMDIDGESFGDVPEEDYDEGWS
jgi:hypothetical protein